MAEPAPRERLLRVVAGHPLLAPLSRSSLAGELHLVGGCVRDAWLGRSLHDLDLTCPAARLEEVAREARGLGFHRVALDPARGILRLVRRGALEVDLAAWRAGSLAEDLAARDLTVNAMAFPLVPGAALVDPCGGRLDLEARRLRPPSRAVLEDDPLRVLRVLRFCAELDFAVDGSAWPWLEAVAPRLAGTAGERRVEELCKLLRGEAWQDAVEAGRARNLLAPALGGEPPRSAAEVDRLEAALDSLPFRSRRRLGLGALRLLLLTARPGGEGPALPLGRVEQRWLRAFGQGEELWRRCEQGDRALLPWLWRLDGAAEGALAAALLAPGREAELRAAELVPRPELLRDGRFLVEECGLRPGPAIRELLDELMVEQVRGRVRTPEEAGRFLRVRVEGRADPAG